MIWQTLERPGYFGEKKDAIHEGYNARFGQWGWRIRWQWEDRILDFPEACQFYEDAYYYDSFMRPEVWKELLATAREVYDIEKQDVDSGLDYLIQKGKATHVQDIAIRNVMVRMGWTFRGKELARVRQHGTYWGDRFSPGKIPFHLPKHIIQPHLEGWWDMNSVEDFYQSNKVLQVKKN